MRHLLSAALAVSLSGVAFAQPPERPGRAVPTADAFRQRLLGLDSNKDGQLSQDEVQDERLKALFERLDADKDGTVTTAEMDKLHAEESVAFQGGGRGGQGGGPGGGRGGEGGQPGRGGQGGPGGGRGGQGGFGGGPGGPGFEGGPGGPGFGGPRGPGRPQPGQILPPFLRDHLELTDSQIKELDELQKEVDARLARILTDRQKKQLKELGERGPGGPGDPGGRGGQGGQGGRGGQGGQGGGRPRGRPAAEQN